MIIISWWIFAYLLIGAIITLFIYYKTKGTWKTKVEASDFKELAYKGESFRSAISLSIVVLAILIPVASGLLAYQVRTHPDRAVDPLGAGLLFMLAAMLWGTYQVYSIATQCSDGDTFRITKDRNWLVPVDFATHLTIWAIGIILLLIFLVFYFNPTISG